MIDLTGHKFADTGGFGGYIKLTDKVGVKLMGAACKTAPGYKTVHEARQVRDWKVAYKEALMMATAEFTRITPKFLGLTVVKHGDGFFPAIFMSHIPGKPIWREEHEEVGMTGARASRRLDRRLKAARKRLYACGFAHSDLSTSNTMTDGKKIYVVDMCHYYMRFHERTDNRFARFVGRFRFYVRQLITARGHRAVKIYG